MTDMKIRQGKERTLLFMQMKKKINELSCCFAQQFLIIDELFWKNAKKHEYFFSWRYRLGNDLLFVKTRHSYAFLCVDFQEFFYFISLDSEAIKTMISTKWFLTAMNQQHIELNHFHYTTDVIIMAYR